MSERSRIVRCPLCPPPGSILNTACVLPPDPPPGAPERERMPRIRWEYRCPVVGCGWIESHAQRLVEPA